ncbi:galactokinase [Paenibacillus massiliensis]|uniref:galactokinase n=1 Tax=Paenibacillus massiliensis TaxID=225917 RepID=UPI00040BA9FB|nr:galactokinase family protein [Paenibacillus massiliensis]
MTSELLQQQTWQQVLEELYGAAKLSEQTERYTALLKAYQEHFGASAPVLFSSPGRSEIGGNHTDHNHGKVLAASIDLDTIAAASKVDAPVITIISEGYADKFVIDISDLSPQSGEGGTAALIRGISAGFAAQGLQVGGFQAYVSTNVIPASGLSSSASFEMLIGTILNTFYNEGSQDTVALAKIGQYAENHFWNKPSGLLDQMACGYGGFIAIDFANPATPVINPVPYNFRESGYSLVIVNTGGNHADLTEDYAAVPNEMKAVARLLGAEVLRDVTEEQIYANLKQLREQAGDRAVMRALHFLAENDRVDAQVEALTSNQFDDFLTLITESGNSSWKWLQNVYQDSNVKEQGISITLAVTELYLKRIGQGACRVHGGGFAGVILAILPDEYVAGYEELIKKTVDTSTFVIHVRPYGAVCLNDLLKG